MTEELIHEKYGNTMYQMYLDEDEESLKDKLDNTYYCTTCKTVVLVSNDKQYVLDEVQKDISKDKFDYFSQPSTKK